MTPQVRTGIHREVAQSRTKPHRRLSSTGVGSTRPVLTIAVSDERMLRLDHARRMTWMDRPPISTVFRRREHAEVNEHRLRRIVERGEAVRIAPGSYVWRNTWDAVDPLQRHAQRVWEAAARLQPGAIFVRHAAAALWSIDTLGAWPGRVDVAVDDSGGGRSTGLIVRHSRRVPVDGIVAWGDHFVTTPAQTVIDIAASQPFTVGVASVDQALWERRIGGALATADELWNAVHSFVGRGNVRVNRVAQFADARSANVRESQSRVLIHTLGFPAPELQQRFDLPGGGVAYSDFWWPKWRVIGELDGLTKYLDERMRAGRSPAQVLSEEKDREDELRRLVHRVARWRVSALDSPGTLWDILTAAGLPTSVRRPG
jgi:hypothetical protein